MVLRSFASARHTASTASHLFARTALHRALLKCSISGYYRRSSHWSPITILQDYGIDNFRNVAFEPQIPVQLARDAVRIDAKGTWLTDDAPPRLNTEHLRRNAETLFLPMELSIASNDTFHRAEAAPFSLFLESLSSPDTASLGDDTPRIYVAQCPLGRLPKELTTPFVTPEIVVKAGKGDIYDSSLWLGKPPTSTPLHRDPNPNLFVQVAGQKRIRILPPDEGSLLFSRTTSGGSGGGFGADERIRGEGMMKGPEKRLLEDAVWGDAVECGGQGVEAVLQPGDSVFIPLGWWHAVRGMGDGINMSVNWWFR